MPLYEHIARFSDLEFLGLFCFTFRANWNGRRFMFMPWYGAENFMNQHQVFARVWESSQRVF